MRRPIRAHRVTQYFHLVRAAALSELDRTDEAREIMESLRSRHNGMALSGIRRPPFSRKQDIDKYLGALRKAGLAA